MIRPTVAGAVPVTVDESSIKDIPGAQVVRIKDLLAVVAEKEWNAVKAAQGAQGDLVGVEAELPRPRQAARAHPQGADRQARHSSARTATSTRASSRRCAIIEGEYEFPTQSHASMGPACAVADVRDGEATIWTSTQKPYDAADVRRRTARPAARQGAGDLDVRHRLLRPQRPGRRHRRRRRAVEASRPPGARAVHAPRRPRLGPEGHGLGQPQPRRARRVRQGHRLREHQQGVLARSTATRARAAPPTCWPAICSGCRSSRTRVSKSRSPPTRSTTAGSAGRSSRR